MNELTKEMLIKELVSEGYATDAEDAQRIIEDQYLGEYESVASYCLEYVNDNLVNHHAPKGNEALYKYLDYEAMANDWRHDLIIIEERPHLLHLFHGHS